MLCGKWKFIWIFVSIYWSFRKTLISNHIKVSYRHRLILLICLALVWFRYCLHISLLVIVGVVAPAPASEFCFHVLSPKGLISDNHLIWLRLQRRQAPASNCFLEFLKGKHNHNHNQGKHGFARHKPNHYTQYSCWNWHEFGSTSLKFRQDE